MKRGFLNTEKAKRTLAADTDVSHDTSRSSKGNAKAER